MTASRVLSNSTRVSLDMRERVMRAVETLGYIPDVSARALASSRTGVVYLVSAIADMPWVARSAHTLVKELSRGGLRLRILVFQGEPDEDRMLIAECLGQSPAGVIITRTPEHGQLEKMFEVANCPVITTMDMSSHPLNPAIGFKPQVAGRMAAAHMLEAGYRNIGFLVPKPDWRVLARLEGFREALTEAGCFNRNLIATSEHSASEVVGADLLDCLKREHPELDAVCCYDDRIALGALFQATRLKLDVPRQLGICGFGGLEAASVSEPGITSFAPNMTATSEAVARYLVERYRGGDTVKLSADAGFKLIPRGSTMPTAGTGRALNRMN